VRSLVDGKGVSTGWHLSARDTAHSAFEVGQEINETAIEAIVRGSDVLRCHDGVRHIVEWERSVELWLPTNGLARTGLVNGRGEGSFGDAVRRVEPHLVFESPESAW
jgi:hypothetical protein